MATKSFGVERQVSHRRAAQRLMDQDGVARARAAALAAAIAAGAAIFSMTSCGRAIATYVLNDARIARWPPGGTAPRA
jgi:hypothetical protein